MSRGLSRAAVSRTVTFPFRGKRLLRAIYDHRRWYFFLVPTFAFLLVFSYYPIVSGFYHAFFKWDGFDTPTWVGLGNLRLMAQDEILAGSLWTVTKFTLIALVIDVVCTMLGAKLVHSLRSDRHRYWYRVIFVIPMVVPWMVTTLIWRFFYQYEIGMLNRLLRLVGLDSLTQAWLGDPKVALYAVMLIGFPWLSSMHFLIYFAGFQAISVEVKDAARIDGANSWQLFTRIELPLIRGQIKLLFMLTVIHWIQNYAGILVLTSGGPARATMVPGLWMYISAFQLYKWGYACAIGVVMFAVIFTLTLINNRFIQSTTEYEAT